LLDGGTGTDELHLSGSRISLDLTTIADANVTNFEVIDITGSGNNTLTIDVNEVLNLSNTSDNLVVDGDTGDTVSAGTGWTSASSVTFSGQTYNKYTQSGANLFVDTDITQTGVGTTSSPTLSVADVSASESAGSITFTVTRAGDTSGASSVSFATASGTATQGTDFTATTGTLNFAAGATTASTSVSITGDTTFEAAETILFNLNSATGATISDSQATGTITNDDAALALSSLDGNNGFKLQGVALDDYTGWGTEGLDGGDINGDGFADMIVGVYYADPGAINKAGSTYVVFGSGSAFSSNTNLSSLDGTNGFRLDGIDSDDQSGVSVANAGDVNGDGIDDIIIGARLADPNGSSSGESYVVFGKSSGFAASLDLSTLNGTNGFRIDGSTAGESSGRSVSSAGDVNGDGFSDLLIGGYNTGAGQGYVIFGKSSAFASSMTLSSLTGSNGFRINGVTANDLAGYSVSGAGDVNGDGFDDLIIGAKSADPSSLTNAGSAYVVFGSGSGFAATFEMSSLNGSNGFRLDGVAASDDVGISVSGGGDVNGDGFADLIIGASAVDVGGNSNAGAVYIVFGKSSGFAATSSLSTLNGTNGFRIDGAGPSALTGRSVKHAGDFNGDGFDDIIVGGYLGDLSATDAGNSFLIYGKSTGFSASIDLSGLSSTDGFRMDGTAGAKSGRSVSSAGDINGDGFDDLMIGDPYADPGGVKDAGGVYVVYGGNFTNSVTFLGTTSNDSLSGTAAAEVFAGGQGNDTLTGGGGGDVFRAGAGDDTMIITDLTFRDIDGGSGADTVQFGAALSLDLTTQSKTSVSGVEIFDFVAGSHASSATIDSKAVLRLTEGVNSFSSTNNTLIFKGDASDSVDFSNEGTFSTSSTTTSGGETYDIYTNSASDAVVLVDTDISVLNLDSV
jgi:hypothetical protein